MLQSGVRKDGLTVLLFFSTRVSGVETVGDPAVFSWVETCTAHGGFGKLFKNY
jgi:hypothetical protein